MQTNALKEIVIIGSAAALGLVAVYGYQHAEALKSMPRPAPITDPLPAPPVRYATSASAAAPGPAPASVAAGPLAEGLPGDILQLIAERDPQRWQNQGVSLWRSCVQRLRDAGRAGPPPELADACNLLLADALAALRAAPDTRNPEEVASIAKELRRERNLLSPLQAQELDRIIAARTRAARKPAAAGSAPSAVAFTPAAPPAATPSR